MKKIGQAEWEVLQYVTHNHPVSVRDVADHMAETRGLARTTVLTVMERLRKKGHLLRKKHEGVFRYSPRQGKAELMTQVISDFVENTLQGTLSPFVAWLSGRNRISEDELEQLRNVVSELEDRAREAADD